MFDIIRNRESYAEAKEVLGSFSLFRTAFSEFDFISIVDSKFRVSIRLNFVDKRCLFGKLCVLGNSKL